jgi:hypothetical protein
MRRFYWLPVLPVLLLAFTSVAGATVTVKPDRIGVELNFSGTTVTVTGTVPAGCGVCLRVTSLPVRVPLNRQGKVAGFWMSVQKTIVEGVPKVYQIYTSSRLEDLPASLREELTGYRDALAGGRVTEREGEKHRLLSLKEAQPFVAALVKLYEKKGLYAVHEGEVEVENGRFTARVAVPAGTPQGKVRVTGFFFKNGRVVAQEEASFTVESRGLVRWLRLLSGTNGPVYGGVAVMVALFTGVAVGMAFGFLDKLFGKGGVSDAGTHAH